MKTFATTGTNDFLVTSRSLVFAADIDAVLLVCRHAAQAILGEMVFAQDQGMPYFETVWIGAPTTAPFEAAFRARIAQVPGDNPPETVFDQASTEPDQNIESLLVHLSGTATDDIGITRVPSASSQSGFKLIGDVDFEAVAPKTSFITPVPGGVGPMTVAMLLQNTLQVYKETFSLS